MESFIQTLTDQLLSQQGIEITAVIFGLISVLLARNENIWLFPTGLISVSIYVYICYNATLYADMGVNVYYVLTTLYGWYFWGQTKSDYVPVTRLNRVEWRMGISFFILSLISIWWILNHYTNSDVPLFDATTTAIFIVAMWWMARKKYEHWMAWIAGNLLSIPLYLYKGLYFTAFQYLVFTIIAISGLMYWKKLIHKE